MAERDADATVAYRVELAVRQLDGLLLMPCVAKQVLDRLNYRQFSPASLADLIEADPALASKILSMTAAAPHQDGSVRRALDRLDAEAVREALLAMKVSAAFEIEFGAEAEAQPSRKDLTVHSVAVACCSERLAELVAPAVPPRQAYAAGLLHDLGKLALYEVMPKSFSQIVARARVSQLDSRQVEHAFLATNHALLGKSLARRWRLPEPVILAIRLHHSNVSVMLAQLPQALVALIVQAADAVARRAGLGHSGSFEPPPSVGALAAVLDVQTDRLQEIADQLPAVVGEKLEALALDMPEATARYCEAIQEAAASLAHRRGRVDSENRDLRIAAGCLDFIRDVLNQVGADRTAIEIAEDFATRWQRFYQTGTLCLFLEPHADKVVEAIVVEALGHSRKLILEAPERAGATFGAGPSSVREVSDELDWLFDQLEVNFDRTRTKLVPLLCDGRFVGGLLFELSFPGDAQLFAERFEIGASVGARVLAGAIAAQRQERLADAFADSASPSAAPGAPSNGPMVALAEMAAGVAHELNNPLVVISGRAQMLADSETDDEKRRALEQIQKNAQEASKVVDDLMGYAEPAAPRRTETPIRQIIEEAVHLAKQKTAVEHVNIQIDLAGSPTAVRVDSGQVVSAIANVLSNCIESYADALGPVKISAQAGAAGTVALRISDLGRGMDAETARRARHPFFSAPDAGRKRGMGLAWADRFVRLNGGTLAISSEPSKGTTVTITLPVR